MCGCLCALDLVLLSHNAPNPLQFAWKDPEIKYDSGTVCMKGFYKHWSLPDWGRLQVEETCMKHDGHMDSFSV